MRGPGPVSNEEASLRCPGPENRTAELRPHPLSYGDAAGRLFFRGSEIYRGIRTPWAEFYQQLLTDGVIRELVDAELLIETENAPAVSLDGFVFVVRHRALPAPAYPDEWCDVMFKEAALLTMRLLTVLAPHGLTLRDANPWNVVFDYTRPVHVDMTSIVPFGQRVAWTVCDEFERFFLRPLRLMERGHGRLARALMVGYEGVGQDIAAAIGSPAASLRRTVLRRLERVRARALRLPPSALYERDLRRLRREAENIRLPRPAGSAVPAPGPPRMDDVGPVATLLKERRPATVLVAGADSAEQARLAGTVGSGVVVLDPRASVVTELFLLAKTNGLRILPLLIDFTDPPPGRGIGNHWAIPSVDRLRSEAVVATGLVEQLVRQRHLGFDHVAEGVAQFTTRWALVDFAVPGRDNRKTPPPAWYTLDRLLEALGRRFRHVSSMPAASSRLLLCEK